MESFLKWHPILDQNYGLSSVILYITQISSLYWKLNQSFWHRSKIEWIHQRRNIILYKPCTNCTFCKEFEKLVYVWIVCTVNCITFTLQSLCYSGITTSSFKFVESRGKLYTRCSIGHLTIYIESFSFYFRLLNLQYVGWVFTGCSNTTYAFWHKKSVTVR